MEHLIGRFGAFNWFCHDSGLEKLLKLNSLCSIVKTSVGFVINSDWKLMDLREHNFFKRWISMTVDSRWVGGGGNGCQHLVRGDGCKSWVG